MSMEPRPEPKPDVEASELKMATAYAIEGLKRCTDTNEYDDWLELFDVILEELNKPLQSGSGSFPAKQAFITDQERRESLIEDIHEISDNVKEIREMDVEEREEMQGQVDEQINRAEEVYNDIDELTSS